MLDILNGKANHIIWKGETIRRLIWARGCSKGHTWHFENVRTTVNNTFGSRQKSRNKTTSKCRKIHLMEWESGGA